MKSEAGVQTRPHIKNQEDGKETEYRDATEEEISIYFLGIDQIPSAVWIVALAGAAERFSFYATTVPWQNYMQNKPGTSVPGAFGLGQSRATIIYNAFYFLSYLTPMPMAVLADTWIGRYRTLLLGLFFYICGLTILFATSFDTALRNGAGLPGFITSLLLISFGVGGVKSAVVPYMIDQYPKTSPKLIKRKGKTPVIGDRTLSIQYIYNVYYWFVNIAGLSSLATTFLEKTYGFWAAFLLPFGTIWIPLFLLLFFRKKLINIPPQGNILPKAIKTLAAAARGGFKLSSATPEYQLEHYGKPVAWDTTFVLEMYRGLIACRVIACFIVFQLCYDQIQNNLISQAGQMHLGRVPNDAIQVLNPIIYIFLGPVIQKLLYPFLASRKIAFQPIARITAGFIIMAMAMGYASGVQGLIYSRGPCYKHPLSCPDSKGGKIPNDITVWAQTPIYFILAAAEIFGFVTGTEYAYSKAPEGMKTVVQALWQLAAAFGGALGMALSPVAKDPHLVVLYGALGGAMVVASALFWIAFKKYDGIDERLNILEIRS